MTGPVRWQDRDAGQRLSVVMFCFSLIAVVVFMALAGAEFARQNKWGMAAAAVTGVIGVLVQAIKWGQRHARR